MDTAWSSLTREERRDIVKQVLSQSLRTLSQRIMSLMEVTQQIMTLVEVTDSNESDSVDHDVTSISLIINVYKEMN